MYDKFKGILSDDLFFYSVVITCIAAASFGLGRLSVSENTAQIQNKDIILSQIPTPTTSELETDPLKVEALSGGYVASKNGSKYHALWCPGAKQIKEENKIYFATKDEAVAPGYTPASNCKGM